MSNIADTWFSALVIQSSVPCFNFALHTGQYRKTRLVSKFNQAI